MGRGASTRPAGLAQCLRAGRALAGGGARTPAGALFEAAHSIGFLVDEPRETLGTEFIVSPQFKEQRDELLRRLNDPIDI